MVEPKVGVLPQPTYMAATRSSKGRSGSTAVGAAAAADKKENPETVKPAKGIASTVSHRLQLYLYWLMLINTLIVCFLQYNWFCLEMMFNLCRLDKLKKQISVSSVLKPNNKSWSKTNIFFWCKKLCNLIVFFGPYYVLSFLIVKDIHTRQIFIHILIWNHHQIVILCHSSEDKFPNQNPCCFGHIFAV